MDVLIQELFEWHALDALLNLEPLLHFLMAFPLLYFAKVVHNWSVPYDLESQLVKKDNRAVALAFLGYMSGMLLIMAGLAFSESQPIFFNEPLADSLLSFVGWSVLGILLLNIAGWMNNKLVLYAFDTEVELIRDQNIGTGAVVAASYFGSSIILFGILYGSAMPNWIWDFFFTIFYFLIAQVGFGFSSWLYEKIVPYPLHKEIERNNVAAGISLACALISFSILESKALAQSYSLAVFVVWLLVAFALILIARLMMDKILVRKENLDKEVNVDKNWGIALVSGGVSISFAVLFVFVY